MEYKMSANSGLLAVDMVKDGDKLIIIGEAYSTFVEAKQATYWNVKVQLPDGTHKLSGLFESECDRFATKWGSKTEDWIGRSFIANIKTSKAGNQYIAKTPTDDERVEISEETGHEEEGKKKPAKAPKAPEKKIEYPSENIDPNDIPF